MKLKPLNATTAILVAASSLAMATAARAAVVANPTPSPQCAGNTAFFNPDLSPNIVLPPGFTASVFVAGLNAPTGIAFRGDANNFEVYVPNPGTAYPASATINHCGRVASLPRITPSPRISWCSTKTEGRSAVP